MPDAPARNCPYRDADGRLRFSTYQTELFDVLGYPVRREGKLFVAGRSYAPSEYADGWVSNYVIRDVDDDRLFAVQPTGLAMADCWPNSITMTWTGDIGVYYHFTPPLADSVATLLLLSGQYTLSKVDFASDTDHSYVRYEHTITGNCDQGSVDPQWQTLVGDSGIDYSITIWLEFEWKDGGVTASLSGNVAGGEYVSYTEPSTVIAYGYTLSISIPENQSAVADFIGIGTFCESEFVDPVLSSGPFISYSDGHFEDETICGLVALWTSPIIVLPPVVSWDDWYWYEFGGLFFDYTCTDLLDYLIANQIASAGTLDRQFDPGAGDLQWLTSIQCQFTGGSYA